MAAAAVAAPSLAPSPRPAHARHAPQPRRVRTATPPRRAPLALPQLLSPSRLLSLSLRGRVWIALVAFALIGIVTTQLIVLRLNTEIGVSLQRAATLQREDATLAITTSEAGSPETVESHARSIGMTTPAPGELRFLPAAGPSRAEAAAEELRAHSVSSAEGLTSNGAAGLVTNSFATPSSGETAILGAGPATEPAATTAAAGATPAAEPAVTTSQPAEGVAQSAQAGAPPAAEPAASLASGGAQATGEGG
jgi:hypothetical protein